MILKQLSALKRRSCRMNMLLLSLWQAMPTISTVLVICLILMNGDRSGPIVKVDLGVSVVRLATSTKSTASRCLTYVDHDVLFGVSCFSAIVVERLVVITAILFIVAEINHDRCSYVVIFLSRSLFVIML